jgi:hypothetical protein
VRARSVGERDRGDDEIALRQARHLHADVLDDSDELVADRAGLELGVSAVVPEV